MIAFTILSAIAGGVCGILDGHTREHKPRQPRYDKGGIAGVTGKIIGASGVTHHFPIGLPVQILKSDNISHYCKSKSGLEQWVSLGDVEIFEVLPPKGLI